MAHIGINDVIELKKRAEEKGNSVHLHDSCGGQFFSTDKEISDELKEFLISYFKERRMEVKFPSDGKSFVLTK